MHNFNIVLYCLLIRCEFGCLICKLFGCEARPNRFGARFVNVKVEVGMVWIGTSAAVEKAMLAIATQERNI